MHRSKAFTLIELLVALAVVAVLLVLLSMGVAKINAAKAQAKCMINLRTIGAAAINYAHENKGYLMPHSTYAFWETKGSERIRKAKWHWMTHLADYLGSPDALGPMPPLFNCPGDPKVAEWPVGRPYIPASADDSSNKLCSYGYNYLSLSTSSSWWSKVDHTAPRNLKQIPRPGKVLLFADRREVGGDPIIHPNSPGGSLPNPLHNGRFNAVFLDGHVERLTVDDVKKGDAPPWTTLDQ